MFLVTNENMGLCLYIAHVFNWVIALIFSTSGEPSVIRKDLQALALAGPTSQNTVLGPLAVLCLDNRL